MVVFLLRLTRLSNTFAFLVLKINRAATTASTINNRYGRFFFKKIDL
jgi:hypothetical protein